jgi:hypothetical protein
VYSISHYVIKFVNDLWQVGCFHRVSLFSSPIYITEILLKVVLNIIPITLPSLHDTEHDQDRPIKWWKHSKLYYTKIHARVVRVRWFRPLLESADSGRSVGRCVLTNVALLGKLGKLVHKQNCYHAFLTFLYITSLS